MKTSKNGVLIRLEMGEELISRLIEIFSQEKGMTGSFSVIGATTEIELGFYSLTKKEYHWQTFTGEYEITGGIGNVSYFEDTPVVHLHTTIADDAFNAFGGHVRKLVVGATCEISLVFHEHLLEREAVPEIGLNLWKL